MSFLAPLFAIGLFALAVPIIVHLVHKERKETTPFPSLISRLDMAVTHGSPSISATIVPTMPLEESGDIFPKKMRS